MGVKKVNVEINAKDNASATFRKVGASLAAVGAGLALATKKFVQAAAEQEKSDIILENAIKNIAKGSDEQVAALKRQAIELQKVGVIGDEVTMMGQAQFATFQASTEAIMALTPAMQDYAVATFGANVSAEQMNQSANVFGKLLQGIDIGRLKNQGIIVSDAQRAVLEYGTEAERVATIQEVMAANLKVTNEIMRETTEGALIAMKNDFGDLAEILGSALLPPLAKFAGWMSKLVARLNESHPRMLKIAGVVIAIGAAFGLVMGPLLLFIGVAAPAFGIIAGAAAVMWAAITGPIGIVVAALAGLGIALYATRDAWLPVFSEMWAGFMEFTEGVRTEIMLVVNAFTETFNKILSDWKFFFEAYGAQLEAGFAGVKAGAIAALGIIAVIFSATWNGIVAVFGSIWDIFSGLFKTVMAVFRGDWSGAWEEIVGIFTGIFGRFQTAAENVMQTVLTWINNTIGAIKEAVATLTNLKNIVTSRKALQANIEVAQKMQAIPSGQMTDAQIAELGSGKVSRKNNTDGERAKGGHVEAGKTYLVGEEGPERFVPGSSGTIIPNGAGGGITLNFSGIFGQDAAEEIGDMVVSKLKLHTAF